MIGLETGDLDRLAFEVRRFLDKTDTRSRLLGMAKLYLEFPDVGMMYDAHMAIIRALSPIMRLTANKEYRTIDDETIEIEFGGISIILTCKQRFMNERVKKTVGYADIQIQRFEWPKDEE